MPSLYCRNYLISQNICILKELIHIFYEKFGFVAFPIKKNLESSMNLFTLPHIKLKQLLGVSF